jgi:hypothetical protein
MNKDDIIRMAHKAGFLIDTHAQQYQPNCILSTYGLIDENLERFANLVAEREREECAKVAREIGNATNPDDWALDKCEEIEAAIRARGCND